MKKIFYSASITLLLFNISPAYAEQKDPRMEKAMAIADEITDLRSEKAASLIGSDTTVTPDLFKKVCGPVKKRAMALAKQEGFKIRHAAVKNRNPDNAANEDEIKFHKYFDDNRKEKGLWTKVIIDGKIYDRYVKPIFVEPACLACHGKKNERPSFIVKKYEQDKAFDFKTGDIRGIIAVMVPEKQ
jgi:hypothetical protein